MTTTGDGAIRWKYWSILDVCEAIKCSCTGASDPLRTEKLVELADWLDWRVKHWQPSRTDDGVFAEFDRAVAHIVCASAVIARAELERRRQP